jgi:betaine-aldehyde dehydrogenase
MSTGNAVIRQPAVKLPVKCGLFYGGQWHAAKSGRTVEVFSPGTGQKLADIADGEAADAEAAVAAAKSAFSGWRRTPIVERARLLRRMAQIVRENAEDLALLDAADGGNPVKEMTGDVLVAASQLEYFAGLVTEMKGSSIPHGPESVNFSVREPLGVVVRILPFNHPFMFSIGKAAAPLAAGNTIVIKPPEQAPLSVIRFAELVEGLFPPGVLNIVPGGWEFGAALAAHPHVAKVALIGSVPTGKAVMRAAAESLKPVLLELGGKNALIAFPDVDVDQVAAAVVDGMNFTWCGQSCGSTSRAFLHESIHDVVLKKMGARLARYRPGIPTDPATTMGAIVSRPQYDKVLEFIARTQAEGGRLVYGGKRPQAPELANGFFIEPTVFADVRTDMHIATHEVFGPVLSVFKWRDEAELLRAVNGVEYGLTCSIWTRDVSTAHRMAAEVEAGYVWINEVSRHLLGSPFGGYKQSGIGREETLQELLEFTQEKHIHVRLTPRE